MNEIDMNEIGAERLVLRPLREGDRKAMIDLHVDARTNRFQTNSPDYVRAGQMVDEWLAHWAEHSFGYCAVIERASGQVVGLAGARIGELDGETVLNLAYRFLPEVWGNGYAVEAVRAVVEWCSRELPSVPLVATENDRNTPSRAVAERVGFTQYAEGFDDGALSRRYRL